MAGERLSIETWRAVHRPAPFVPRATERNDRRSHVEGDRNWTPPQLVSNPPRGRAVVLNISHHTLVPVAGCRHGRPHESLLQLQDSSCAAVARAGARPQSECRAGSMSALRTALCAAMPRPMLTQARSISASGAQFAQFVGPHIPAARTHPLQLKKTCILEETAGCKPRSRILGVKEFQKQFCAEELFL